MIKIKWDAKQCGVYCIRNTINRKQYIGSSVNCYHRIKSQHLARLRNGTHTNPHLQFSFRKYGEKAFEYFIVELCKEKHMIIKEQLHIDNSKCLDRRFGYNVNIKAEKTILTDEQCEKIRLSKLGKKRSAKRSVGVYKSGKNWMVKIGFHREEIYLGSFRTEKEASLAYREALSQAVYDIKPTLSDKRILKSKPVIRISSDGDEIFYTSMRAAVCDGFNLGCISQCCCGKQKAHKGFCWRLA
jgi:group I intron endonuclease